MIVSVSLLQARTLAWWSQRLHTQRGERDLAVSVVATNLHGKKRSHLLR